MSETDNNKQEDSIDCIEEIGIDFKSHAVCPGCDGVYKESDLTTSVFSLAVNHVAEKFGDPIKFYICPNCYHLVCVFK